MFALKNSVVFSVVASLAVRAAPSLNTRATTTALTTSQIDAYTPYTWYASTGYCESSTTINWSCGALAHVADCEANPTFKPVASGGDGDAGTDPSEFLPDLTDVDYFLTTLDTTLFPGVSSSIEVHNGFGHAQSL
ncbi:hypothetical protein HWV62_11069 [Athelia sp. TMB]|nr:hypothetical protein HWV62_11069 [Athelia sp. TMB]